MIDCERSEIEFEYAVTNKNDVCLKSKVDKIFLDEQWNFEAGHCPSWSTMLYSGKDIAILLLKHEINDGNPKFPEIRRFMDVISMQNKQLECYGYPFETPPKKKTLHFLEKVKTLKTMK